MNTKSLATCLALLVLTGCATQGLATIKVAVPIECRETEPQRPVMPTELLLSTAKLDAFVQAAQAEIERREGFEQRLVTALRACIAPVSE